MLFDLFKKREKRVKPTTGATQQTFVNPNISTTPKACEEIKFLPKEFFIFTRDFSTDYNYCNKFSSQEVESRVQMDFRAIGGCEDAEFREFEFDDYSIYMYIFNDGDKDEYGRDITAWLCAIVDKGFANNYTINNFKQEINNKIDGFGSLKYNRWDLANEFVDNWKIDISTKLYSQSKTI